MGTAISTTVDSDIIHPRFGHAGSCRIIRTRQSRSVKFPPCSSIDLSHDHTHCDACNAGASRRRPFPKRVGNPYKYILERDKVVTGMAHSQSL